jgi:hypothetical protein
VHAIAWVALLWPSRRTRRYFFALLTPMVRSLVVASIQQPLESNGHNAVLNDWRFSV